MEQLMAVATVAGVAVLVIGGIVNDHDVYRGQLGVSTLAISKILKRRGKSLSI
jgi:hypothetical protein